MSYRRLRQRRPAVQPNAAARPRPEHNGLVWGKEAGLEEPYALIAHMLDAATLIIALAEDESPLLPTAIRGLGKEPIRCLALLAAVHDIGKATTGFEAQVSQAWDAIWPAPLAAPRDARRGHTAPGQASAVTEAWVTWLVDEGLTTNDARMFVGTVIGSHHGRIPPEMTRLQAAQAFEESGDSIADWAAVREEIVRLVWEALGRPRLTLEESNRTMAAVAVCGLVPLADWIVSQASYIEPRRSARLPAEWTPRTAESFLASGVRDARRELERIGIRPLKLDAPDFRGWFGFTPRGVQTSICGELSSHVHGPGLLIIMDRTGRGKTEASLEAFRHFRNALGQDRGLGVFLPTMATTDSMFRRVVRDLNRVLGRDTTVELLHSMASVSEEADRVLRDLYKQKNAGQVEGAAVGEHASDDESRRFYRSDWNRKTAQRLHSAISVGTVDQVLGTALPGPHQPFRLSGLLGKVVIIDECHAYDPYMQVLLRRALRWLAAFGVPVILLSATLPGRLANKLIDSYHRGARVWRQGQKISEHAAPAPVDPVPYPGWVHYDTRLSKVTPHSAPMGAPAHLHTLRTPVSLKSKEGRNALSRARRLADGVWGVLGSAIEDKPGNALVVVNTVATAQVTAAFLRERVPQDCRVDILHANMPSGIRDERTSQLEVVFGKQDPDSTSSKERPRRSIVVATQVAEQSLDWDFDVVVSELAPLALLLQRAGRAHRHRPKEQIPDGWKDWTLHVVAAIDPDSGEPTELLPYPHAELIRTWSLLEEDAGSARRTIRVPHDVQALVDQAAQDPAWLVSDHEPLAEAAMSCWAEEAVQTSLGEQRVICAPDSLYMKNLYQLTQGCEDIEHILATRLGALTRRVLPVWRHQGGLFLDADHRTPMPRPPKDPQHRKKRTPSHADVRTVMRRTVPVRDAPWQESASIDSPDWFDGHPLLADIRLVPFSAETTYRPVPELEGLHGHPLEHRDNRYQVMLSDDTGLFAVP
ncbi:CRISPR-associated helicase Cas3' [Nocardiopsis sp. NPDC049922]|uniref:CRISPR-associated helicase Cas3' n=1 Tax=Nocardiopsis sp. NPDC049922 TaxID=3155157 RepID=UPI0033F2FEC3